MRRKSFSDRSACYPATGKSVVTQDIGVGSVLSTGEGLFVFQTMEDFIRFRCHNSNYERHCFAAHEIAREYFNVKKVMEDLLHRMGLGLVAFDPCHSGART